jgi:hypothetical protein
MTDRAAILRANVLKRISACGDMPIRIRDKTFESLLRTLGINWETSMGGTDGYREIDACALEALVVLAEQAA